MAAQERKGANPASAADHAFQERFWRFQRLAWVALALFIAAGIAGFTGHGGPWARQVADAGGGWIDYPPVARWQTAESLEVSLPPSSGSDRAEVLLPASFLAVFEIEGVTPEPEQVTATADGARYAFAADPARRRPARVHFAIRARDPSVPGAAHRLEVAGRPVSLRMTVLP